MRVHALASLVLAFLTLSPTAAPGQSEALLEVYRKGSRLYEADRYAEAEPLWEETLERTERELGMDHPAVAAILSEVATAY